MKIVIFGREVSAIWWGEDQSEEYVWTVETECGRRGHGDTIQRALEDLVDAIQEDR